MFSDTNICIFNTSYFKNTINFWVCTCTLRNYSLDFPDIKISQYPFPIGNLPRALCTFEEGLCLVSETHPSNLQLMCSLWLPMLSIQSHTEQSHHTLSLNQNLTFYAPFLCPNQKSESNGVLNPLPSIQFITALMQFFPFNQILEFISTSTNSEISIISYPKHPTNLLFPSSPPFTASFHSTSNRMLIKCSCDCA